jgi:HEAT repeat protein
MVRFQATNALLSLDFETGISILLQQVSSEESWYNRSNAIHGLKQYYVSKGKTGEAVDLLISSLNDKHPNVRGEAAWFLGAFKSERSYEPLLRLAQSDKKISVRLRAASSIACLNPEKGLELLTNLLKRCDDIETYCWAIRGLGRIKSEKSVQLIRPYLKSDFSEVRSVAEEIIAKIK